MPIVKLPDDIAMQIAAGEVIERPASVVKELIENSIDAGATNIRVEIRSGGLSYLRITDDGSGIPFHEVPTAFERHATSKIRLAEDLYNLHTLGFRGEALPSVAAVSQMSLLTRPRPTATSPEEAGSEITIEGGKLVYHRPAGAPYGTVITVRNLFYNLPARQKFARSGSSEAGYILNTIGSYGLAYPEIKFSLMNEGRLVLQTDGTGNLRDAVARVLGADAAAALLFADSQPPEVDDQGVVLEGPPSGGVRVHGVTADPRYSKPNRNAMYFFVNRRWVVSRLLSYAVQESYQSLLMTGRFPVCVLMIEVDPAEVDANVHPAKTEVRFLRERQVYATIQKAVRNALLSAEGGGVQSLNLTSPITDAAGNGAATPSASANFSPNYKGDNISQYQRNFADRLFQSDGDNSPQAGTTGTTVPTDNPDDWLMDDFSIAQPSVNTQPIPTQAVPPEEVNMPAEKVSSPVRSRLPLLRVVGQMSATYIVAEAADGMYLIDQHAAHERVLYEHYQDLLFQQNLIDRQLLLQPLLLDLDPRQTLIIQDEEKRAELAALGFEVELDSETNGSFLKSVPNSLHGRDLKLNLAEILDEAEGIGNRQCEPASPGEFSDALPRQWRDKLAASLACHSAVRGGQILSLEEMRELIVKLEQTRLPGACAHGRPTLVHLSQGQLERGFGRK